VDVEHGLGDVDTDSGNLHVGLSSSR